MTLKIPPPLSYFMSRKCNHSKTAMDKFLPWIISAGGGCSVPPCSAIAPVRLCPLQLQLCSTPEVAALQPRRHDASSQLVKSRGSFLNTEFPCLVPSPSCNCSDI